MTMIEDREQADSAASESGKLACDMAAWLRCDACGIAAADDVKLTDCSRLPSCKILQRDMPEGSSAAAQTSVQERAAEFVRSY